MTGVKQMRCFRDVSKVIKLAYKTNAVFLEYFKFAQFVFTFPGYKHWKHVLSISHGKHVGPR